jgi:hypothetical protein
LLRAVLERTHTKPADTRAAALEWFDAGYLVETYRQLGLVYEYDMRPGKERFVPLVPTEFEQLDGYELLQRALALALAPEAKGEIDFAASLMTREPLTATHRKRAAAAAAPRSLLAQNLAIFGQ